MHWVITVMDDQFCECQYLAYTKEEKDRYLNTLEGVVDISCYED